MLFVFICFVQYKTNPALTGSRGTTSREYNSPMNRFSGDRSGGLQAEMEERATQFFTPAASRLTSYRDMVQKIGAAVTIVG